jgi:hypothetical protein
MADLAKDYGVPPEVMAFVDAGFLEVLAETPDEKTVEFHIPSKRHSDIKGTIYAYDLTWIHPDFNARFCHDCHETPGDLPNFYATQRCSDDADEHIDLETLDDLVCWLEAFQTADVL